MKYGLFRPTIHFTLYSMSTVSSSAPTDPDVSLTHSQRCVCICVCTRMGVSRGHMGSYFTQTPLCLQHTAGTALPDIPSVFVCAQMSPPRSCTHTSVSSKRSINDIFLIINLLMSVTNVTSPHPSCQSNTCKISHADYLITS